ncbi:unnamed protein product [Symbiodinium necroappetens]|uniref:Ion transport domain-containing protein n=1 Tax=Symbiodinium necroappetens TaxID=1628268 RepID=A0A812LUR8_9DINO|nr:unnamed protein product [Symbiodinium necroappetens]
MLLPLLPSHLGVYRKGGHFLKLRHFPLAYVLAALKALVEIGESFDATKMIIWQELVARISKLGVDYDQAHAKDMERLEKSNALLANFDPADFSYGISSGVVVHKTTGAKLEGVSAKDLDGADKAALQGYGRPYVDGKPGKPVELYKQGEWCSPVELFDTEAKFEVLKDKCLIEHPNSCAQSPYFSFCFWVTYTLLITFMVMNLVIAVILEGYEVASSCKSSQHICLEA